MDAIGILPPYKGILVHDRWVSYDKYENCTHSYCNAHLLRELKFVYEELGKNWAASMIQYLLLALYLKKRNWLNPAIQKKLMNRYEQIITAAMEEESKFHLPCHSIKRRRKAKPKSLRLLEVSYTIEKKYYNLFSIKTPLLTII